MIYLVKILYKTINSYNFNKDLIKLYNENCYNNVSYCCDDNKKTILINFYLTKIIPKYLFFNKWNRIKIIFIKFFIFFIFFK